MEIVCCKMSWVNGEASMVVQWIGFTFGIVLVILTYRSIIGTIIVPRAEVSLITYRAWQVCHGAYMMMAKRMRSYDQQDRLLASLAPVTILFTLAVWVVCFLLAFALLFLPFVGGDFWHGMWLSGSSLFTLGVTSLGQAGPVALEFLAAASGLTVIALLIGYLPTIYGAYNRRETLVTALSSRAGDPAWGPEVLARHGLDHTLPTLCELYRDWEKLAADIMESHSSYPWLIVFRSPDPLHSWVMSLLAVMDSAALYLALSPSTAPMEAGQCLRMGFLCMRKIGHVIGANVNDDPRPNDPIDLTFDQFTRAVDHLRHSDFPLERTAEEAWRHYQGWRVNYESAAYALADFVVAVPAPWSGPRANTRTSIEDVLNRRPRHRTPDDPEGEEVLETDILHHLQEPAID
jgi:hypothetical protein